MVAINIPNELVKTREATLQAIQPIRPVEEFIRHLWSSDRKPAQLYIESGIPSILTMAKDGTYMDAMRSVSKMKRLIDRLSYISNQASNMDW